MSVLVEKCEIDLQSTRKYLCRDSFVDISDIEKEFINNNSENFENSCEDVDPLRLDSELNVDINKNCEILKSSDDSHCRFDDAIILLPDKTKLLNGIDRKIFMCNGCKSRMPKMRFPSNVELDHTYSKITSFLEKEEIEPCCLSYRCCFCTSVFMTPKMYLIHLALKHNPELLKCTFCPKRKPVFYYLKPHRKFYEKYSCCICKQILFPKSYLAHLSRCRIHNVKNGKMIKRSRNTFFFYRKIVKIPAECNTN